MATRRPLGRNPRRYRDATDGEFQQEVTETAPTDAPTRHAPVPDVPPSATGDISTP